MKRNKNTDNSPYKQLDKTLKEALPEEKKTFSLFVIFLILTILALGGIFASVFLIPDENWKNVCLSISSGLFGSGFFASAIELLGIRNKKALIDTKLNKIRFSCENLITFISDGFPENTPSKKFKEWVNDIIQNKKNSYLRDNLYSRLFDIIESCNEFSNSNFNRFENPHLSDEKYSYIHSLSFICRLVLQNLDSKEDGVDIILKINLGENIPKKIGDIFSDLKPRFQEDIPVFVLNLNEE